MEGASEKYRLEITRELLLVATMSPALWGGLSALSLGTADFMARYSTRSIGHISTLLGVLTTGCLILTGWIVFFGPPLNWSPEGWYLIVINGIATTLMTLLLYQGLARGPVSLVAPIVASHPVLVVALAVFFGARPTLSELGLMALTIVGVVIVARTAEGENEDDGSGNDDGDGAYLRSTIAIALGATIAYAVLVFAGQRAVPIYGELQTLWTGRLVSFVTLVVIMIVTRHKPNLPLRILPFLIAQGTLDAGGYLTLFAGSAGEKAEIAAVVSSTFAVVTVLFAWVILKERIRIAQWLGIALISMCVALLAY